MKLKSKYKSKILIITFSVFISSCSSLDKSMIYSGLSTAVIGGFVGKYASPDKESDKFNIGIGAAAGALIGAGIGAYFFNQDPDNRTMKTMLEINPDDKNKLNQESFDIGSPINEKYYTVYPDTSKVPSHLKDKIKKQIIIEKTMPAREIIGKNGKTTIIPETKILEYDYQ
jgi:hypothetical protein